MYADKHRQRSKRVPAAGRREVARRSAARRVRAPATACPPSAAFSLAPRSGERVGVRGLLPRARAAVLLLSYFTNTAPQKGRLKG